MTQLPKWAEGFCWQRARPAGAEASLVSCVVVPGFDYADFRLEHG